MIIHDLDQQRSATNLENAYSVWIDAERKTFNHYLKWKQINNTDYLCQIRKGTHHEKSLGSRSTETEKLFEEFKNYQDIAKNGAKRLLVLGRLYKATNLPVIETFAGEVLRSLDRHKLLGNVIQVIGTNAITAYELEAQRSIDQNLMMTEDFDLVWRGKEDLSKNFKPSLSLFDIIKETDSTWTVNEECSFRLMNQHLQIIELLVPPSLLQHTPKGKWKAIDLESQEELIGGLPVEHVVADLSGKPAKIVAPDPRLFMLHKWILSKNPERKPAKQKKDRNQSIQLKELIEIGMPNHPFDEEFVDGLNDRLRNAFKEMNQLPQKKDIQTNENKKKKTNKNKYTF
jgi:hypothetical protein